MVVVNEKWAQLSKNYDIENKSYTQMVIDIKNLSEKIYTTKVHRIKSMNFLLTT